MSLQGSPMPDDLLAIFRARLAGADPTLPADLEAAVLARREERGGHTEWGLLCEEAGLLGLASPESHLALPDPPDDPVAGRPAQGELDHAIRQAEQPRLLAEQ